MPQNHALHDSAAGLFLITGFWDFFSQFFSATTVKQFFIDHPAKSLRLTFS
jgi:hypothetical protein